MQTIILGRTGLRTTVAGLGGGGHSRLGMAYGMSEAHAAGIVRHALDLGITFIDTAESYGTEAAIGAGIKGADRSRLVLSSKVSPRVKDRLKTAEEIERSLTNSLKALGTEYLDVYLVHGVGAGEYAAVEREFVPVLRRLRDRGLLRAIGLSEAFASDTTHRMLSAAVQSDCWDVMMVGFNYLNQSAARTVLPETVRKNIGTLDMFAVRHALVDQERLRPVVTRLVERGVVDEACIDRAQPLQFLFDEAGVENFSEAGYRFCLAQPGIHVVLTGTGNKEHLEKNVAALAKGPLAATSVERLRAIFGNVDSESGQRA